MTALYLIVATILAAECNAESKHFPPAATTARPNILFIHVEDMGVQLPIYGDNTQDTPHLRELAEEGMVFETAHVAAASCAPSRGAMLTGLYPIQNGIWAFVDTHGFRYREGLPTFVKALHDDGYKTGLTYKFGVDPEPVDDFDQLWNDRYDDYDGCILTSTEEVCKELWPTINESLSESMLRMFEHFLETTVATAGGAPFFFLAQTNDAHVNKDKGWNEFNDESKRVDPSDVNPANFAGLGPFAASVSADDKASLTRYYAAVLRVDDYIGGILKLVEDYGHTKNTMVVFSSDHGISHTCKGKTTAYEGGLRVPFVVRWPGVVTPGTRSDALVSFVDIAPTFLDVAGIDIPSYLPGRSLVPVLSGRAAEAIPRKYLFSAYTAHTTSTAAYWPTRTVRDDRYKLIHNIMVEAGPLHGVLNRPGGRKNVCLMAGDGIDLSAFNSPPVFELFDLVADPDETTNRIGDASFSGVETELKATLLDWRTRVIQDPFLDEQFRYEFQISYYEKFEWFKEQGGQEGLDSSGRWVDWSDYRTPWDPDQYTELDWSTCEYWCQKHKAAPSKKCGWDSKVCSTCDFCDDTPSPATCAEAMQDDYMWPCDTSGCMAVINNFQRYQTCDAYCQKMGLSCEYAWKATKEKSCRNRRMKSCAQDLWQAGDQWGVSSGNKRAICKCSEPLANPEQPSPLEAWSEQHPDPSDFYDTDYSEGFTYYGDIEGYDEADVSNFYAGDSGSDPDFDSGSDSGLDGTNTATSVAGTILAAAASLVAVALLDA